MKILTSERQKGVFTATDSLYRKALEKFGDNARVINPAFTDYGGTAMDAALIRFYKENEPDKIVWEETSWNGENAICLPLEGMDMSDLMDTVPGFEEEYFKLENELIQSETEYFCKSESCEGFRDEIRNWLEENGHFMPTNIDYDWDELRRHVRSLA